ncbi:glycoside hydrolase family 2 TIM barrel-domain containing protein [Paenarthrobacter sp. GOM3]|uniref:glycoside hydrolase family 2 protein n=1 Tax=Paenarthrobacter sp. GOM3 TaxID=2782567 RepID=UPI001BACE367|nr:sugar-binding domain-containing protein [Paenarthrobacter sp. GOM3]WOH20839.1 glycoside hydrolase family 2 TIM barrel-domain containing protein [Paenarthrobacter sp. GOM3]
MTSAIPKPEHPRPQLVREKWMNLNGTWGFEIDAGDSGLERGLTTRELNSSILVPFAPESVLSGIEHVDFMEAVWYRRTVTIPADWAGQNVLLHFGAVDHDATVWVNGVEVARHRGGFTPFTADLGGVVEPGADAVIVVRARDSRHGMQARGKQATWYNNTHCQYTRTTGIWQTVWLEAVPEVYIKHLRMTPNLADCSITVEVPISQNRTGHTVSAILSGGSGGRVEASVKADLDLTPTLHLDIPAELLRPWSIEDPFLYDLEVNVLDGAGNVVDHVDSYAAIRSIALDGKVVRINGEAVFQRLVLDQGYWPDSLMTSPDEAALIKDIELSMAAGFNGARLHQKIFEERFLYHADRLGYLVWGEFGDWGVSGAGTVGHNQQPTPSFVAQWLEVLRRDYNHPAIIGWCPLNETHQVLHDRLTVLDDVTQAMFLATKLADPTRPVIDASGYSHRIRETDIYDSHSYQQDPERFRIEQEGLAENKPYSNRKEDGQEYSVPYAGQPYFVSEFGGIWWNEGEAKQAADGTDVSTSWGYGQRVGSEEEFYARFDGLCSVLLENPDMFGYCYTQLTDVFQEKNGIFAFDRSNKFDLARIRASQTRQAAVETPRK